MEKSPMLYLLSDLRRLHGRPVAHGNVLARDPGFQEREHRCWEGIGL